MSNEEIVNEIQSGVNVSDNMQILYEQNIGLILDTVKKFKAFEDMDDLRQEAYFGLSNAVESYTSEKGASFATFLRLHIEYHVMRYLEQNSSLIRIPPNRRTLVCRYNKLLHEYKELYGCFPSNEDVAELLQVSTDKVDEIRADSHLQSIDTLNRIISSDGKEVCLIDAVSDAQDCFEDCEERMFQLQLYSVLWELVESLEPIQKNVIEMKFRQNMTYEEIGIVIGKSRERTHQILEKALSNLRKKDSSKKLKSFLTYDLAYYLGLQATGLKTFRKTHTSSVERAVLIALEEEERRR